MARALKKNKTEVKKKKTSIGNGKFSKFGHRGGGPQGSTTSKLYRKRYRGQGRRR
jgi:hypothetical protein